MAHNTLMQIADLSGFRVLVLANRLGCDNDIARQVHDKLAGVLAGMIEAQRNILAAERVLAAARGTSGEEDAFYELHHYHTSYYETWLDEAVALLDAYLVDDSTNEFFNFKTGCWNHWDHEVPFIVPVPADMLCGLAKIITQIEDAYGISFTIRHVCYSEAEAEGIWWKTIGKDLDAEFGMKQARHA